MRIFISWSGDESRALAEVFHAWIQSTLQAVRPYFSPADIDKGARWASDIADELSTCGVGLIFLTRSNLNSNWIMFEAGAISKTVDRAYVCPFLFGIEPTDVKGPLTQFQATRFEKTDVKKLFITINSLLGEQKLPDTVAENVFERWWPDLEKEVRELGSKFETVSKTKSHELRSDRDLLEEILSSVRSIGRNDISRASGPAAGARGSGGYAISLQKKLIDTMSKIAREVLVTPSEARLLNSEIDETIKFINNRNSLIGSFKIGLSDDLNQIKAIINKKIFHVGDTDEENEE